MTAKEMLQDLESRWLDREITKRITSSTDTSSQTGQSYNSDAYRQRPRSKNSKLNPKTSGAEISPAKGVS